MPLQPLTALGSRQEPLQPLVEGRSGLLDSVTLSGQHDALSPDPLLEDVADGLERLVVRAWDGELRERSRRELVERDLRLPRIALTSEPRAPFQLGLEASGHQAAPHELEEEALEEGRGIVGPVRPELRPARSEALHWDAPARRRGRRFHEGERADGLRSHRRGVQGDDSAVGMGDDVHGLFEELGQHGASASKSLRSSAGLAPNPGRSASRSVQRSASGSCSRHVSRAPVTLPWTSRTGGPSPSPSSVHRLSHELPDGAGDHPGAELALLGRRELVGRVAQATAAGNEEHGRRNVMGEHHRVVAGAARHAQRRRALLARRRLQRVLERGIERHGVLPMGLPQLEAELLLGGDSLQRLAHEGLQAREPLGGR